MTNGLIVGMPAVAVGVFQGAPFFKRVTRPLARFGFRRPAGAVRRAAPEVPVPDA